MANYFRITAYHPTENFSVIMDSNGMFEKTLAILVLYGIQRLQNH